MAAASVLVVLCLLTPVVGLAGRACLTCRVKSLVSPDESWLPGAHLSD